MDINTYRMFLQGVFQCTQCGTCCKNCDPLSVNADDIKALAKHFKIPYQKALRKYTRPHPDMPSMKAFKHTGPCKFYDAEARGCKIYEARPRMCRAYPFMSPQQRGSPFLGVYDDCPGMLLTLEVFMQFKQFNKQRFSDSEVQRCGEYLNAHPEAEELLTELIRCASAHMVFGEDTIEAGKRIGKKLSPHLAAMRAMEASG